jgi:AcrR family transcriptional regulator
MTASASPTPAVAPIGMRERILRATLALISAEGVAVLTNRRVATAAGVSLGSLTYHFTSQTELLRESLLLYVEEETARQEAIAHDLALRNPSLEEITHEIEQIVAGSTDTLQQIAELELHLQAARDPELRAASRRCFAAHEKIAAAALTSLGVPEGERYAPTLVALMTGLAVARLADGGHNAQGTADSLLAVMRGISS